MNVFYRPEQVAKNPNPWGSPSSAKPALVVSDWLQRGLIGPEQVQSFEPVQVEDLKRAHCPDYVEGVMTLQINNGFENRDKDVARSLPFTSGSFLAAARHALAVKEAVCSPTSGFHHAGYRMGGGFCTFNGLVVTAMKLKALGLVNQVGILDLDMHYGDGTAELIRHHGLTWIRHHTQGSAFQDRLDVGKGEQRYRDWLNMALADLQGVDIVLYQASADPHINDPLGGLLSEQAMCQRDEAVFRTLWGRPLVWNLAGGYQVDFRGRIEPVLRLHRNTLLAYQAVAKAIRPF